MNEFLHLIGPRLEKHTDLQPSRILFVEDHYEPDILENLLDQAKVKPELIITDFFAIIPNSKYNIQYWPIWLAGFDKCKLPHLNLNNNNKGVKTTFNFMAFKPRKYRVFALKVLEYFNLSTTQYVSNHINDPVLLTYHSVDHVVVDEIINSGNQELIQLIKFFTSQVKLPYRFFNNPKNTTYDNVADYNNFLKHRVFDRSAISLILETIEPSWSNAANFSEKTMFSAVSNTIPIWLGGYQQAELWKNYGFDVFDDIVNHSYQYKSTNVERIFYAVKDNIEILADLQKTKSIHESLTTRFEKNLELLRKRIFLSLLNQNLVVYPAEVQQQVNAIVNSQCGRYS